MQEQQPTDNRIETLAKTGSLDSTFQRFAELSKRFNDLQGNMYAQQARFASVQDSDHQGMLGDESKNLEINRIRQGFLAELEEFKRDLHELPRPHPAGTAVARCKRSDADRGRGAESAVARLLQPGKLAGRRKFRIHLSCCAIFLPDRQSGGQSAESTRC